MVRAFFRVGQEETGEKRHQNQGDRMSSGKRGEDRLTGTTSTPEQRGGKSEESGLSLGGSRDVRTGKRYF